MSFNISILIQFYATYPSKTVGAEMLTFCYSISQARRKLQNQFSSKWWSEHFLIVLRQCKIDSWDWTLFSFVFHMVSWRLVLVMVPTVFDKTQALNHLELSQNAFGYHQTYFDHQFYERCSNQSIRTVPNFHLQKKFLIYLL